MITGISLRLMSFVDSWDWGRRSMQLVTHTMERFLTTLPWTMSPVLGLREPCRVADIRLLITVIRQKEQELFAVEVR